MVTLFKSTGPVRHHTGKKRFALNSILATLGYILSPLSWWNDMVVNVPLAYGFAIPFSLLNERLFLPAFIIGYWLTNVLGFVLLHKGVAGLVCEQPRKQSICRYLMIAFAYTAIITVMVWLQWIPAPTELINSQQ